MPPKTAPADAPPIKAPIIPSTPSLHAPTPDAIPKWKACLAIFRVAPPARNLPTVPKVSTFLYPTISSAPAAAFFICLVAKSAVAIGMDFLLAHSAIWLTLRPVLPLIRSLAGLESIPGAKPIR